MSQDIEALPTCERCGGDDHLQDDCAARCPESKNGRHHVSVVGSEEHLGDETYLDVVCTLCGASGVVQIDEGARWSR